ncbi:MAG TPA: ABC transporter permease [Spirochaetota bacterium]|nr:ABC transporter permease [Spirochaetota bacterium]HPJ33903.1 ABC transporter permease [Spirochaetota bacterium]
MFKTPLRRNILRSFIAKEFRQILRDYRMRAMLFGTPVIMLLIFGYAVNTDVVKIRTAVLDSSRSYDSRNFIQKFTGSGYFVLQDYVESPEKGAELLDRGEIDLFINIPYDFSRGLRKGRTAEVQIIADGSDSIRSSIILTYVNRITYDFSEKYLRDNVSVLMLSRGTGGLKLMQSVDLQERTLFNPELTSRNFYLPGVLGLLVALITIMMTSMSVVRERESGTIEQIIVSPVKPMEFVAGKTLPFAIVGFIDIVVITLVTIAWFRVPFNGSFLFLLFCGLFFIICTLALGLYISTISQTQQQAMLSTFLFFLPSIMLSGFVFPIDAMPLFFQAITFLNPMRYFMTIIRGIFLKGVGASVLWGNLLGLVVLSVILLSLSVRRVNRRFE